MRRASRVPGLVVAACACALVLSAQTEAQGDQAVLLPADAAQHGISTTIGAGNAESWLSLVNCAWVPKCSPLTVAIVALKSDGLAADGLSHLARKYQDEVAFGVLWLPQEEDSARKFGLGTHWLQEQQKHRHHQPTGQNARTASSGDDDVHEAHVGDEAHAAAAPQGAGGPDEDRELRLAAYRVFRRGVLVAEGGGLPPPSSLHAALRDVPHRHIQLEWIKMAAAQQEQEL